MVIKFRDYQANAIDIGLNHLRVKHNKKGLLSLAAGAGKSFCIAGIVAGLSDPVLILQPNKEILVQNREKYTSYGFESSVYSASLDTKEIGHVTYATIGSIYKKPELFQNFRYVIIDECDLVPTENMKKSMYYKFLSKVKPDGILGLTASPFKAKRYSMPVEGSFYPETITKTMMLNQTKPKFWDKVLYSVDAHYLLEQGYLAPLKFIPLNFNEGKLVFNSTGGAYTDDSIDKWFIENRINNKIPKVIQQAQDKGRKHHLVFVNSIQNAKDLSEVVPDSSYVCADTKKKDRDKRIEDFKEGKLKVMFNVGVFEAGFDFPQLDNIIHANPTLSMRTWQQRVGRGQRVAEDKVDCTVVEMTPTYARFGSPYHWSIQQHNGKWCVYDFERNLTLTKRDVKELQ